MQPFLCCGVGCAGLVSLKETSKRLSGGCIGKLTGGAVEDNSVTLNNDCIGDFIVGLAVEGCDVGLDVGLAVVG